nr:ATPase, T2SS/T4P/T4SS family [Vibrio splendidus]MCC4883238.1 GspE family protein [Vibrio splendidus]
MSSNDSFGSVGFSNFVDMVVKVYSPKDSHFSPSTIQAYDSCPKTTSLIEAVLEKYREQSEIGKKGFRINHNNDVFRCSIMPSILGDHVLLRRMPQVIWPLKDCLSTLNPKFADVLYRQLTSSRLNGGGIILVCGTPGNGKSTTCASIVKERLQIHGGHCNTIEDPCEMPLHGKIGEKGYCIQREVDDESSFEEALRDTLRGYPTATNNILMLGEIRDSTTAEMALNSAIDGRLVISTFHAAGVVEAIKRLLSLATESMGISEASDLLASSLRAVIHQRVIGSTLSVSCLFDSDSVTGAIRDQQSNVSLEHLRSDVEAQMKKLNVGIPILRTSQSKK